MEDSRRCFDASNAKGALPRTPRFHENRFLSVAGITVDSVQVVSETYPVFRPYTDFVEGRCWLRKCDWLSAKSLSNSATAIAHDDLWRVLIADRLGVTQPAPPEFRQRYDNMRRLFEISGFPAPNSEDSLELLSLMQDAMHYIGQMGERCRNRRFAVTSKKHMGLVPHTAKVGDLIVILDGCRVPFVLRRSGKNFRLIGECYIHGIMHGEAAPAVQAMRCPRKCRCSYGSHLTRQWKDFLLE